MDDVDKVAIKMLQPGVLKQSVLDAFCNEISILHGLRHPNVVMMMGAHLTKVSLRGCAHAGAEPSSSVEPGCFRFSC